MQCEEMREEESDTNIAINAPGAAGNRDLFVGKDQFLFPFCLMLGSYWCSVVSSKGSRYTSKVLPFELRQR